MNINNYKKFTRVFGSIIVPVVNYIILILLIGFVGV